MIQSVVREKQRLDRTFSLVEHMQLDPEVMSHWARYLCILTSGFIETSVRLILQNYVTEHAGKSVADFIQSRIEQLTNLNDEKISQLLGAFDPRWRDLFQGKRSEKQKDAIDSVLANRHQIAHGRSVSLTLARMKQYYAEISNAIKIIDEECVKNDAGRGQTHTLQ